MKFILFVEGHTEHLAIGAFLKRWLDARLEKPVGVQTVRFEGWPELVAGCAVHANKHLDGPKKDVIAVIGLLDLYGPTIYPASKVKAAERSAWAKADLEKKVNRAEFSQHFAVHETEAWLLSDPTIFPVEVRKALADKYPHPERVNSEEPSAKLLDKLYKAELKRGYRKTVDGKNLFGKLNPEVAYQKCPSLAALLDEMLRLAE